MDETGDSDEDTQTKNKFVESDSEEEFLTAEEVQGMFSDYIHKNKPITTYNKNNVKRGT